MAAMKIAFSMERIGRTVGTQSGWFTVGVYAYVIVLPPPFNLNEGGVE
jgi:hypothetical protein